MYRYFLKRLLDFFVSILVLPFFLIIYIIVGIIIKIDDGGPIFYKCERIGKNGRIFKMFKFRSMKVNSPNLLTEDGSTYNAKKDPRLTRIGRVIRETSIDEIPQILNILKGDMSIIGPRASMKCALDTYLDDEKDKMKVRPGITGYNQAYFRNSISNREKRLYDAWYANNVSFWLDVKIFFKTIQSVFKRKNIYIDNKEKKED